ncbi:MAG: hypothetical protein IPI73_02520 [Betaproteobacteria bacterium]|nr:hypothetical protein [Betaproteobacteria bacterium]
MLTEVLVGSEYIRSALWSVDGGATWTAATKLEEFGRNIAIARVNPANGNELAAIDAKYLLKSSDNGKTWLRTWTNPGLQLQPDRIWWFEGAPSTLIALAYTSNFYHAGVIVSHDGGASFADARYWANGVEVGIPNSIYSVARLDDGTLYFKASVFDVDGREVCGLYSSRDGGLNWSRIYPLVPSRLFARETLFSGLGGTLWLYSLTTAMRSKDGGVSWQDFGPVMNVNQTLSVTRDLVGAIARVQPPGIQRLVTTRDGGDTFMVDAIDGPIPGVANSVSVQALGGELLIDPLRADVMYAFSPFAPIRRSLDGGLHWHDFAPNLSGIPYGRALDTIDGRTLRIRSDPELANNLTITYRVPAFGADATVHEFFNANLGHYFMTADAGEAAGIDNGAAGPG